MTAALPLRRLIARSAREGALLLALTGLAAQAQSAAPVAGRYRIAGTVVNAATGEPVRRAEVAVLSQTDSHTVESAVSDGDGHFALERLAAAKYQLTASKRGFRTSFFDAHEEYSTAIVTGEGLDTTGLVFRLMPGAVLRGVVTGDGGDAVEGAKVMLFERPLPHAFSPGKGEQTTQVDAKVTDDTGAYEFDGLAAGEYLLAVTAEPWFALHRPSAGGRKRAAGNAASDDANGRNALLDVAYPVTFFDSTTDESSATRIVLKDGGHEEANINLRAVPALHLVVETPMRQDGSIARAELRQTIFGVETSAESAGFLDAMKTGTVEFSGVAPGRYELVQGDPPRVAELEATASQQVDPAVGSPVVSVSGYLRSSASAPGVAMAKGAAPAQGAGLPQDSGLPGEMTLTLSSVGGTHRARQFQATAIGGAFSFPMVPAGLWELWAESGGLQLPIVSTMVGSRTVAGNRVTVQDKPVSLVLTISEGGTRVEGFVRKGTKGVAGAMVVLAPTDPTLLRALVRRDQSDSDGSFSLRMWRRARIH